METLRTAHELAMDAPKEPLVVNFPVPAGLTDVQAHCLVETWYAVLAPHDFVYLGGTTFALHPPCPTAEAFRGSLPPSLGAQVEVETLSRVLQEPRPAAARPKAPVNSGASYPNAR